MAKLQQVITLKGRVQGVGMRPFVHQLATRLGLTGWVANEKGDVTIKLEGARRQLTEFHRVLQEAPPPKSKIENCRVEENCQIKESATRPGNESFKIIESEVTGEVTGGEFPLDYALCHRCQQDLFTPDNRRYLYPFTSCTECGPRFCISHQLPFDRSNTSLAGFKMCRQCEEEYKAPVDRRFHAQTLSCPQCGPGVSLRDKDGKPIPVSDPYLHLWERIQAGNIVAVKGGGGFHLVCDASNAAAVKTLRARKHRPDKPLVVMGLNAASLRPYIDESESFATAFNDDRAPIVLARKSANADQNLAGIAPDNPLLGIMKAHHPIYYLLFHAAAAEQTLRLDWLEQPLGGLLAVTSANLSGEPLIADNQAALEKLQGMADYYLLHDLTIVQPLDDSVMQVGSAPLMIRLGRGFSPTVVPASRNLPNVLACGAYLKSTVCMGGDHRFLLSPHIGDLSGRAVCEQYRAHFNRMLALTLGKPDAITCDRHPDFYSVHLAEEIAEASRVPLVRVQHHHAHVAAVLAEYSLESDCFALVLDGFGLGEDDQAWGGEFFKVDSAGIHEIGHLCELKLPGGDRASQEPWRLGYGMARELDDAWAKTRFSQHQGLQGLDSVLDSTGCQRTRGAGRWFDAVAAILGFRGRQSFEGQAAIYVEALATGQPTPAVAEGLAVVKGHQLDVKSVFRQIMRLTDPHQSARFFHTELIDGLTRWFSQAQDQYPLSRIVCSGGCFQNRILRDELGERLLKAGFSVYFPKSIPVNDAGISLGQAWLAGNHLMTGKQLARSQAHVSGHTR